MKVCDQEGLTLCKSFVLAENACHLGNPIKNYAILASPQGSSASLFTRKSKQYCQKKGSLCISFEIIHSTGFWEDFTSPLNNQESLISDSGGGGDLMRSDNFQYKLILQNSDGNLVLHKVNRNNNGALWASHTGGHGTGKQ